MIPIYKAKKIDSDEDVKGDLFLGKFIIPTSILSKKIFSAIKHIVEDVLSCSINEDCKNEHIELKNMLTKLYYNEKLEHITEINPSTLAISFDGGKSFIKLSDLEVHTCTDFKLEYTNMKMNKRKDVQPPNGSIFTIITDKGR